jgi:hypothetical protein
MTNIVSECRSANIVRDHAMILPDDATPKPDGIFGKDRAMGIRDRPISPRSAWQNPYVERLIGTVRRECLDRVLVFGEAHPATNSFFLRGVLQ